MKVNLDLGLETVNPVSLISGPKVLYDKKRQFWGTTSKMKTIQKIRTGINETNANLGGN